MFHIDPFTVVQSDWKTFAFRLAAYHIAAEDEKKRSESIKTK